MEFVGLAVNFLVAVLLATTLIYCFRLDKRLTALRSGQDGFKEVIAALDRATERAQGSLAELKVMGVGAETMLKTEIKRADALLEELKVMVQSADRVANRLVEARPPAAAPSTAPAPQKAAPTKDVQSALNFDALRQAR
jgi:tetrahydromethanopterin S-methyltransferase subunit F